MVSFATYITGIIARKSKAKANGSDGHSGHDDQPAGADPELVDFLA